MIDVKEIPEDIIFGDIDSVLTDLYYDISQFNNLVLVSDTNVEKTELFKNFVNKFSSKFIVDIVVIPAGELNKTESTKSYVESQIFAKGYRRNICILAIGGGVVLDLAGFVAANFCRGVCWIAIPTSLMAMVDVCVGGKTGVNTKFGKNTLGIIYPPKKSFIMLNWLYSLPYLEYRWALTEVIKMAAIYDEKAVDWLIHNAKNLREFNKNNQIKIFEMIKLSVAIKYKFVKNDLNDQADRRFLNFGHTLAHAIESYSSWNIKHGQAVSMGILFVLQLNHNNYCFLKIIKLMKSLDCLFVTNIVDPNKLWNLCFDDKKIDNLGNLNWIILSEFGKPFLFNSLSKKDFLINLNKLKSII